MIDLSHQISAVRREVGRRTLDAGEARIITLSRTYAASPDELWDACTNPQRIPRWFLPVSGDLRPGGRFQLEGNAGGTIERCDPPRSFAATWEYGGEVSWIEVVVSAEPDGRARFTLEHIAHVDDERWAEFGPGAVGIGWDLAVMGLSLHLASGQPNDPQEFAAWMASEEGRQFVSESSERWCSASIAAGTEESEARAAAERVTAFYTATPEASAST
jgi:uncharacterized protein YndB with AHSA1/START domain